MCGVIGFIDLKKNGYQQKHMSDALNIISHRGPDASGSLFFGENNYIGLGHVRLSIQDPSPAGAQPMQSDNGRYTISYNGEIYNHLSLRKNLEREFGPISWKGSSDTETLLWMLQFYDMENTLKQVVGMFSFAVYDKRLNQVFLARDRIGEKPLYIHSNDSGIIFASQLKALECFSNFSKRICLTALGAFFRTNYIPAPLSIYKSTFKCPQGSFIKIDINKLHLPESYGTYEAFLGNEAISSYQYWSTLDIASPSTISGLTFSESQEHIESLLENSIERCMISDVPLGAFLSGGVDSSLIASLMQKNSTKKIQTFTIGFEDQRFDESRYAKEVACHLGTDHNEVILSNESVIDSITNLGSIYDEPFADSSQIPTLLVSNIAKQKVTVALSGDGGDELFGGYNRYLLTSTLWNRIKYLPSPFRNFLGKFILTLPTKLLIKFEESLRKIYPNTPTHLSEKIQSSARWIQDINSQKELYFRIVEFYNDVSKLLPGYSGKNNLLDHAD